MSIVFYLGYVNINEKLYGSEIALLNLAKQLQKWYKVYFVSFYEKEVSFDGIEVLSPSEYSSMTFDIVVILRYINFYLYCPIRAPKVLLWLQDVVPQSSFMGNQLPMYGKYLLENVQCQEIIVQTHWHKNIIQNYYQTSKPISVIGNGIDTSLFKVETTKILYSFIWTSSPIRGLDYLLKIFPLIHQKYPESRLNIYRGSEEFTADQLEYIHRYQDIIHYHNHLSNEKLSLKFLESDVWLYPTNFSETYCISSLEAQASGCLCICSNLASLTEVVSDRGILLNSAYGSDEYFKEIMNGLETLFQNREEYSNKAREWGLKQDWSERTLMWRNLLLRSS